jgi:hypothetical protein
MIPSIQRNLRFLVAAAAGTSSLFGLLPVARGMAPPELPPTNLVTVQAASFKYLGSPTKGYEVGIPTDDVYGWRTQSTTPPKVTVDYKANTSGTARSRVCRTAQSGGTVSCSPDTNTTLTSGKNITTTVNVGNSNVVYGPNIGRNDYIKLSIRVLSSSSSITPRGAGIVTPKSITSGS